MTASIGKMNSADYYVNLQREDYYLKGGEPPGHWTGRGAERLGLRGAVDRDAIRNLLDGNSPDSQKPLTQQQNYSKIHAGCGKVRNRQLGWDITFSAPKPVSAAWAVAPQEVRHEIESAVRHAAHKALEHLEEHAAWTRRGQGGKRREHADLVVAVFPHSTSRALDPQYHLHCLVMNLGVRQNGSAGTLDSKALYQDKMLAGSIFRAELANELTRRLGYRCQPAEHGFKIDGIPDKLCEHWSKRRHAIQDRLTELGQSTAAEAAAVTLATRRTKGQVPPREQLLEFWQKEAAQFGLTPQMVAELARPNATPKPSRSVEQLVDSAVEAVAAKRDTFTQKDVVREVLDASIGSGQDAKSTIEASRRRIKTSPQIIRLPPINPDGQEVFMTRQARKVQFEIAKRIKDTRMDRSFVLSDAAVERMQGKYSRPAIPIVEELKHHASQLVRAARNQETTPVNRPLIRQQAAQTLDREGHDLVKRLTQSPGRITVINHAFNEQRDTALRAATKAWQKAGYQVIACARQRRDAQMLEQQTGAPGMTLRKLQLMMHPTLTYRAKHVAEQFARAATGRPTYTLDSFKIDSKKVLILDRADRLSLQELSQLARDVQRQGGKLVLLNPNIDDMPHGRLNMTASLLHNIGHYGPWNVAYHFGYAKDQPTPPVSPQHGMGMSP